MVSRNFRTLLPVMIGTLSIASPSALLALDKKGVNAFGYIENEVIDQSDGVVKFKWEDPKHDVTTDKETVMQYGSCWSNLKETIGTTQFKIDFERSGEDTVNRTAQVNPKTGKTEFDGFSGLSTSDGDSYMGNIWSSGSDAYQQTQFFSDATFAYGMAWVGWSTPGNFLDGRDQAYAYATSPMTTWMGDLRQSDQQAWDAASINKLVLPGAHDAGMWRLAPPIDTTKAIVEFLEDIVPQLPPGMGGILEHVLEHAATEGVYNFIQNVSLTQKDSTADQLKSGIRYFDFRPGQAVVSGTPFGPTYYHIHSIIPGDDLVSFVQDIGNFLNDNSDEIVVVNVKGGNGEINFPFTPLYGSSDDLENASKVIAHALSGSDYDPENAYYINDFTDVNSLTLGDLYSSKKRLIFFFGTGYQDSYPSDATGYNSIDPCNMVAQLNASKPNCIGSTDKYAVFQFQDTSTDWLFPGKITSGEAGNMIQLGGSPLLATKGYFDSYTYPWAAGQSVQPQCTNQGATSADFAGDLTDCDSMVVTLNDFAGNLLALNAQRLTAYRTGVSAGKPKFTQQTCDGLYQ